MREHRALRAAGRAARVLEERDVVAAQLGPPIRQARGRVRARRGTRPRSAMRHDGTRRFTCFTTKFTIARLRPRQVIADPRHDHVPHLRVRQRMLARSPRSSRARRSPARRCRRADARARESCTSGSRSRRRARRAGSPNSTTGDCSVFGSITATRSPRVMPGSDCRNAANARLAVRRRRSVKRGTEIRERGRRGEAREARLEQLAERRVAIGIDLRGHSARIRREPGLVRHSRHARTDRGARARRSRTRSSGRRRSDECRRAA